MNGCFCEAWSLLMNRTQHWEIVFSVILWRSIETFNTWWGIWVVLIFSYMLWLTWFGKWGLLFKEETIPHLHFLFILKRQWLLSVTVTLLVKKEENHKSWEGRKTFLGLCRIFFYLQRKITSTNYKFMNFYVLPLHVMKKLRIILNWENSFGQNIPLYSTK